MHKNQIIRALFTISLFLVCHVNLAFGHSTIQPISLNIKFKNKRVSDNAGLYMQEYTINTKNGHLILRSNLQSGSILYVGAGHHVAHLLLHLSTGNTTAPTTFYGPHRKIATVFMEGNAYIIPIYAGDNNYCVSGIYLIYWKLGSRPDIMNQAVTNTCIRGAFLRSVQSGLIISVQHNFSLTVEKFLYDYSENRMTNEGVSVYNPPVGFTPLAIGEKSIVKILNTRYGALTQNSYLGLHFRGIDRHFHNDSPDSFVGFAPKAIQNGDKDIAVVEIQPMGGGSQGFLSQRFQLIIVGQNKINISRYFGSSYTDISYRVSRSGIIFAVGEYAGSKPTFITHYYLLSHNLLTSIDQP